jgi:hypothetical protein
MELTVKHNVTINDNMSELKAHIQQEIDNKYNVVVTQDTVKESKTLMADINKDKKSFADKCKEFLVIVEEPIKEFKAKQKEITGLYDSAYVAVKQQVSSFEVERLQLAKVALNDYLNALCAEKDINPESISINDLIILTAITPKGSIASASKEKINNRVASVEAEILRAKLAAEEEAKRNREIADQARKEEQEQARIREQEMQAKFERDKQQAIDNAVAKASQSIPAPIFIDPYKEQHATTPNNVEEQNKTPEPVVKNGVITWSIQINCTTQTSEKITSEQVKNAVSKKLIENEIEFNSIEVSPSC